MKNGRDDEEKEKTQLRNTKSVQEDAALIKGKRGKYINKGKIKIKLTVYIKGRLRVTCIQINRDDDRYFSNGSSNAKALQRHKHVCNEL
ncbi:hypothetical protein AAHA92_25936 [Salvia divinorum]|uniref:Uncharacterized protein n=1 Tax=Salvia divinorum TaxID=28513 RepID=A0ABD1GCA4_SALDI